MAAEMKNKVQTVTGLINPEELGRTLAHEHLSMSFDVAYIPPREEEAALSSVPFTLDNLGWIRYHPYSHKANLKLNDAESEAVILEELQQYQQAGGTSIVECTTHGIQRKPKFLQELSEKTGVNIVAGTGFYIAGSQRQDVLGRPLEVIVRLMTHEITSGCIDAPDVRCGLLGELGCSWPLQDFEKRVVQAAGEVSSQLGCPVSLHPGRNPESPFEIVRIFQEAGGDCSKVAMCHLDRTIFDESQLSEFAELGTYCEFDLFGVETSHYQLNESADMPSDAQRIQRIWQLVDEEFEDKILLSQDIHTKHRLAKFGGHGYSHILKNIVPKMLNRGLNQNVIDKMLIKNPQEWLTFK